MIGDVPLRDALRALVIERGLELVNFHRVGNKGARLSIQDKSGAYRLIDLEVRDPTDDIDKALLTDAMGKLSDVGNECAHPEIVEGDDGYGRCTSCGDNSFPLRDPAGDEGAQVAGAVDRLAAIVTALDGIPRWEQALNLAYAIDRCFGREEAERFWQLADELRRREGRQPPPTHRG